MKPPKALKVSIAGLSPGQCAGMAGALYTENDGENKPLASGESTSIRFIKESHCNRTSMSGSEAEASSESRRGLISAMSLGFVDAAEETRRRA